MKLYKVNCDLPEIGDQHPLVEVDFVHVVAETPEQAKEFAAVYFKMIYTSRIVLTVVSEKTIELGLIV